MNRKQAASNIVLLGNGFDLYLGKKTKYIDFINNYNGKSAHFYYFRKNCNYQKLLWIDLEEEIIGLHSNFLIFQNDFMNYVKHGEFTYSGGMYQISLIDLIKIINFSHHENEIFYDFYMRLANKHLTPNREIHLSYQGFKEINQNLINDFNQFRLELKDYLNSIKPVSNNDAFKNILKRTGYCINYNYTSTLRELNDGADIPMKHIHGSIESEIVFGVPWRSCPQELKEISKELQVIANDFSFRISEIHFMNLRISDIVNQEYKINKSDLKSIDYQLGVDLFIIGHSLGETDWHTLRKFIGEGSIRTFRCIFISFYNLESKADLIVNLMNMLGQEEAEELIEKEKIVFIQIDELNRLFSKES